MTTNLRKATTEDGYTFYEQPDGTWTDGDMTWQSLDELLAADLGAVVI